MKTQGDTKRPRSVKAEFDPNFAATALGGSVLAEKAMRSLGVRRTVAEHLPARSDAAQFSTVEGVYALMGAMLVGSRGIGATESLREDAMASEIFGLEKGAPSDSTNYRILCDIAGLPEREASDHYEPAGRRLPALDLLGQERRVPMTRRIVPEEPERAKPEFLTRQSAFLASNARGIYKVMPLKHVRLYHWRVVFGDGTDLEVEGICFDAARKGRDGRKALRWMTLSAGPVIVAQELVEGNHDEGRAMAELLDAGGPTIVEMTAKAPVLALLDGAFFEKQVIEPCEKLRWDFIVCANQQRNSLTRIAEEMPEALWSATGSDVARGWAESWNARVTIVARRWREEGELPGIWHYAFLATRIEPADLPASLRKKHGYCQAIWMLYGTKQGRENHYKTPLRDLGLHHPPSCRLGVNQSFYTIGAAASNIAMVLRYVVVEESERGIELWRLRERYMRIAGYLIRSAHTLTVRLSGVCVDALRQTLWQRAFAAAGRL
jgi:hypothetical protein